MKEALIIVGVVGWVLLLSEYVPSPQKPPQQSIVVPQVGPDCNGYSLAVKPCPKEISQ